MDGYSFAIDLDKDKVEFGLDNCCTNHVCFEKKLFKEMRDPSFGIGVLSIGGIEKPIGIGTIVFKITNIALEAKAIELQNFLYMPSIPKNLISISQWSAERKDDCGILSRGSYSIFLWSNDASQKLVPHPVNRRVPMLQAYEGGETEYDSFQEEYKPYLHDQYCLLATGPSAGSPYVGIERRGQTANTPNS
eukprot:4126087-Ditylum_brightwellii.AAC.1